MPFEEFPGGGVMVTGRNSLTLYRTMVLISAVKLGMQGIKVRRGPVVWKSVKKEFNIEGGRKEVLAWLEKRRDELAEKVKAGDEG